MLSRSGYSSRHVEAQMRASKEAPLPSPDRLLTDRGSYIAYLESQLERVSAACLTVQSFDERLEQAVGAIRCLEEKTLNLAKLVSVSQQYAEQQETAVREAQGELTRRLRAVEGRLAELEEPGRAAEWEAKLRSVSAQLDAKLQQMDAAAEARLAEAAGRLQAGLAEGCHAAHLDLQSKLGDAAGRLAEVERRVRAVDEYAHAADSSAAVADLAKRLGGVEDSVAHLAKSDGGMKASLGSLQQSVAQLKTAVVALELRPPLGGEAAQDCLQWLERAREALRREVADIQQQHVQLAAGLNSAVAVAAAAKQSPQKALAAQVLSGLQGAMHSEVGKELQALQLADQLLCSVSHTFRQRASPPRGGSASGGSSTGAGGGSSEAAVAGSKAGAAAATEPDGDWAIAAAPAAGTQQPPAGAPASQQAAYPQAPTAQRAVEAAADGALVQLQQLAGGEAQLAQAVMLASAAANGSGCDASSSSSLRQTFSQMQNTLQSVCALLQPQEGEDQPAQRLQSDAAYQAAASRYLSRSSTLQQPRAGSPAGGQPRPAWGAGSGKLGGGSSSTAATARVGGAATASRSLSFAGGGGSGLGSRSTREALRESVLGQAALEQRRRRLQELYSELKLK